ncbi:glycosyltransferase family 4 protein [Brevibacillus invocatus]|uniref:glycosyltransferase family 4 protein n=1 Tax=Brevibacillus invocatus TaxID=173959 RepID=UPI0020401B43|nr:glycosyltransferase family 1 protein [Brevibacillus invocatus]MCM3078121.1 glycosyltransferase family 4 protein [Brevibacillus invocatus]MCM3428293.1 glycosyltransferase family 4 protein [Brevibacillus invocatus]
MRIGVNLLAVIPGKIGGMEQYVRNLISYSQKNNEAHEWYLFLSTHNFHTFSEGRHLHKILFHDISRAHELFHQQIQALRLDLWFCPLLILQPIDVTIPSVINIPDIQHEFYPQFFDAPVLQWRRENYQSSAQKSSAVLTLSEFSRRSILEKFQLPPHKVHAVHLDSSGEFSLPMRPEQDQVFRLKYQLPDHYGLFPANTWRHKNHLSLIQALAILRNTYNYKVNMVFTGFPQEAHQTVINAISQHQLWDQIKWLNYIPQDEMPSLYRNAHFLCFPSLFEGFGIPLVEAMRSNIPIICSNAGSIPEVVGQAALLFDPHVPEDIAVKIAAMSDPAIRADLIAKGTRQATLFSWDKCARQTLAVFQSVLRKTSS